MSKLKRALLLLSIFLAGCLVGTCFTAGAGYLVVSKVFSNVSAPPKIRAARITERFTRQLDLDHSQRQKFENIAFKLFSKLQPRRREMIAFVNQELAAAEAEIAPHLNETQRGKLAFFLNRIRGMNRALRRGEVDDRSESAQ